MTSSIEKQLRKLSKDQLVQVVAGLYGLDDHLDNIINRHLVAGSITRKNVDPLTQTLSNQLDQLLNPSPRYNSYESYGLSEQLAELLKAIKELLASQDLSAALHLTEKLLNSADDAFHQLDDSDGCLGDVFSEAASVWLNLAAQLRQQQPDAVNWVEKILFYWNNNDYGVFDALLSHSRVLLTEQELYRLAEEFETEISGSQGNNFTAISGLRSIAAALSDLALYEKSYRIGSRDLNGRELESLAHFALEVGEVSQAEQWLALHPEPRGPSSYRRLRSQCLLQQGRLDQLKLELLEDFEKWPNHRTLENYWEVAIDEERQKIKSRVENLPEPPEDLEERVKMLIQAKSLDKAEGLLVSYPELIKNQFYMSLQSLLCSFDPNRYPLACVVLYRALLNDLLERGYTRAYHHGARYFHRLRELDQVINDYQGLINAQAYIRQLQSQHGRKRSFWKEASYPAKPHAS